MRSRVALLAGLILAAASLAATAQSRAPDVIRGRVTGPDSTPLVNATVTAIDTVAKVPRPTRTDAQGAYSISFDNGGGTYMVAVTMLGYAPQRRVVSRNANGTMPVVDFKMTAVATRLGAVNSVGERPKTMRTDIYGDNSVGGTTTYTSLSGGTSGDMTGDLTTLLSTIPGISVTPSATGGMPIISAFGVGADQNGLTLNGMGFGAQVPRDGFRLAVVSASYDPSKGGFAGVLQSLRMTSGANQVTRSVHATLDAPELQWTSPVASQLGNRYGQQILSGAVSGPIVFDKAFYSASYQLSRRASDLASLASADRASLAALRLSPDTVSKLLQTLTPMGIPVRTAGVPRSRQNLEGRFALRLDYEPNIPPAPVPSLFGLNNSTVDDYYIELGGTLRNNDGTAVGVTSIPSFGAQQAHRDGWVQLTAAKYLPRNILNETTVSLNGSQDRTEPYLDLPSARILLATAMPDGSVGLSSAQVGGNSSQLTDSRTWLGEIRNQTTWNTWDRRHSFSVTLDGIADGYSVRQDAGFGSFAFNSLQDFAAGVPASYSRTLTGRHTSGNGFSGAIGIGETYNPVPFGTLPPGASQPARPTVQYGVQLEGSHFGIRPAYNRAVDSVFHRRTDFVPGGVRAMPMLGFSWPMLPELKGPNGLNFGRRGVMTGGVRRYRGTLSTRAIDLYTRQTGLPDAIQQINCVGPAAPIPEWRAYEQSVGSIPTQCLNGAASTTFAQATPPVSLFSPQYEIFDSWRPQLAFNYTVSQRLRTSLTSTWALNRNVPGTSDINFNRAARFMLGAEGNRPVYVAPGSIVAATGTSAWTDSRVSPLFAHVTESRSDLRSETRQLGASVNFSPGPLGGPSPSWLYVTSLTYTLTDGRDQFRGFGGSTAGNPSVVEWSRTAVSRHGFNVNLTVFKQGLVNITFLGRIQSGHPFTPTVSGDVNGDGYFNDRAFVFNPATADTSIGNAMSRLLRDAPPGARKCLTRQLGSAAGRNSCTGAWSMPQLNMSISPDAYRIGLGNRGSVQLYLNNVLSGLDQSLHGSSKLHGWGQFSYGDPTLLTVRGFDPATNRFKYTVNPLFGSSSQFRHTFRAPFMLTIDARIEVGPDRESQSLTMLLRTKRGDPPLTEQQIKSRIARAFNPIDQVILAAKDSVRLTDAQVDTLRAISQRFAARRDSIVTAVARFLIARNGDYGGEEVRQGWHSAGVDSYRIYLLSMRSALGVLTPEQKERSKSVPQLQGMLQFETIRDSDLAFILRGSMTTLP